MRLQLALPLIFAALAACSSDSEQRSSVEPAGAAAAPRTAALGQPAPDFTLVDAAGGTFTLSEQRGVPVVLEWFNPGCPYVVRAHEEGCLASYPAEAAGEGVVWVAINSGAQGKQGAGAETNAKAAEEWDMGYPVLLDESGAVGRAYGAKTTPHLFVIDAEGVLVYAGAVDDDPRGKLGDERTNYVEAALREMQAGAVSNPETKPYGCSVKYAN